MSILTVAAVPTKIADGIGPAHAKSSSSSSHTNGYHASASKGATIGSLLKIDPSSTPSESPESSPNNTASPLSSRSGSSTELSPEPSPPRTKSAPHPNSTSARELSELEIRRELLLPSTPHSSPRSGVVRHVSFQDMNITLEEYRERAAETTASVHRTQHMIADTNRNIAASRESLSRLEETEAAKKEHLKDISAKVENASSTMKKAWIALAILIVLSVALFILHKKYPTTF